MEEELFKPETLLECSFAIVNGDNTSKEELERYYDLQFLAVFHAIHKASVDKGYGGKAYRVTSSIHSMPATLCEDMNIPYQSNLVTVLCELEAPNSDGVEFRILYSEKFKDFRVAIFINNELYDPNGIFKE
jgi:hypothetical protein